MNPTGSPIKKRRLSLGRSERSAPLALPYQHAHHGGDNLRSSAMGTARNTLGDGANFSTPATSRLAGQTVAPFLAKHIPNEYAHLGRPAAEGSLAASNANTKYCYRHRPDMKCRRQADEPSMDQLQHVSLYNPAQCCIVAD